MLILSRKIGEKILIGGDIEVMLVAVRSGEKARIGIQAPRGIAVDRAEVREQKKKREAPTPLCGQCGYPRRESVTAVTSYRVCRCYGVQEVEQ